MGNLTSMLLMGVPGLLGGGATAFTFLLRDSFTPDEAAPVASPRTADGAGHWHVQQDADDTSKIVSGSPQVAQATGSYEQRRWVLSNAAGTPMALSPRVGLAMRVDNIALARSGVWAVAGFSAVATLPQSINTASGGGGVYNGTIFNNQGPSGLWSNGDDLVMVLRTSGGVLLKGDGTLLWVWTTGGGSPVYAMFAGVLGANQALLDYVSVARLPGAADDAVPGNGYSVWGDDYGIAKVNASPAVADTDYSGYTDALIYQTITAPAALAGEAGFWFRRQDANNGYKLYFDSAGALKVEKYVGGSLDSTPINSAGSISAGAAVRVSVVQDGTGVTVYVDNTSKGTITDSSFSAQSTVRPFADASWTGGGGALGRLEVYPRDINDEPTGEAVAAINAMAE